MTKWNNLSPESKALLNAKQKAKRQANKQQSIDLQQAKKEKKAASNALNYQKRKILKQHLKRATTRLTMDTIPNEKEFTEDFEGFMEYQRAIKAAGIEMPDNDYSDITAFIQWQEAKKKMTEEEKKKKKKKAELETPHPQRSEEESEDDDSSDDDSVEGMSEAMLMEILKNARTESNNTKEVLLNNSEAVKKQSEVVQKQAEASRASLKESQANSQKAIKTVMKSAKKSAKKKSAKKSAKKASASASAAPSSSAARSSSAKTLFAEASAKQVSFAEPDPLAGLPTTEEETPLAKGSKKPATRLSRPTARTRSNKK